MDHRQHFYHRQGPSRPHDGFRPLSRPFLPPILVRPQPPVTPGALRFPTHESPSLSPTFDLSQYSVTASPKTTRPQRRPSPRPRCDDSSRSSSSIPSIVTPDEQPPPKKRRPSVLENLLIQEEDIKPLIPWTLDESYKPKLFAMPDPAFPIQFPYSPNNPNNPTAPIDPTLSSVRSSADQLAAASGSPQVPTELRFNDETLHSATSSPGAAVLEAALQHAQAAGIEDQLVNPDVDALRKDQPFSRSPELRISHKLAERKRRKEMKELFDELREHLPAERGSKSSKWEILSKAIDNIVQLKRTNAELRSDNEALRRELDIARGNSGQPLRQWQPYYNGQTPSEPLPVATTEDKE